MIESRRRRITIGIAILVTALAAQRGGLSAADAPPVQGMATYQLALLSTAPGARPLGEREIQALQEDHLRYLKRLFDEGTIVIEGPIDGAGMVRSIVVLAVPTREEAEAVLGRDPWIAEGRLVAEIHPWWAAEGIFRRPVGVLRQRTCALGLLRRPVDAPNLPEEDLRSIQEGHLENIRKMAESGDLVIAGPLGDDTRLRGVLVFRSWDPERIHRLVAQDPAVRAGRLECDLHPWYVPEGVFP